MGKKMDQLKSLVLGLWLKQEAPPIQLVKRKEARPLPDPPVFVDRYQENLDHEFDRSIKEIVAEIKSSENYKKGGPL